MDYPAYDVKLSGCLVMYHIEAIWSCIRSRQVGFRAVLTLKCKPPPLVTPVSAMVTYQVSVLF